ncbi:MAG: GNAT family N-acetyltransferase [Spirochaetales bacterium]|nr:GNAT family N-acetyltransferase [Spirochaetales bacterium]
MNGEVSFRKPTSEDYELVRGIWEDPETMAAVGGVQPRSAAEYARWFESVMVHHADVNCYFLVFSGNDCVGEVSFHHYDRTAGTAELNIKTKTAWRGRGIGKRALHFILSVFFNEWGGREMRDTVWEKNPLGRNALLKFGFREIGRPNGDFLLAFERTDFFQLRST